MSLWDNLTGDEGSEEEAPRRKQQWGSRDQRRASRPRTPAPARNQRPAEVSERVWGMAEHWLERGTATMGRRPPVNLPEFSKRLADTIRESKPLQAALKRQGSGWDRGPDYVTEMLADMVERFWRSLEAGEENSAALQFRFLDDYWDNLLDAAQTNLKVRRLQQHGRVVPRVEVSKHDNPYLKTLAAQKEREFLERALATEDEPIPERRKRPVRKPLRIRN